jgi:hypothetical protein
VKKENKGYDGDSRSEEEGSKERKEKERKDRKIRTTITKDNIRTMN